MATNYLLAIDQGTTSSRAILFTHGGELAFVAQEEFSQHFPRDGWVEHNPGEIWQSVVNVCREVLVKADISAASVTAIGITNQRETTLVWDSVSGEPVYNAIVWQDRRTASYCDSLRNDATLKAVQGKTGLLLDPYFSATKIRWILDQIPGAQARAENGELLFGTIDSFLIWKMTGAKRHVTDATNASRTLLFNIHQQCWDEELLNLFNIPAAMLPEVLDCAADFGTTTADFIGSPVPISGVAGDQQAALVGQACFKPGMCKSTYGTGCFMIMNTGTKPLVSTNKLLTTIAYRLNGETTYGLEGSIFMAGATIQWLRDGVKLIKQASDSIEHAIKTGIDHSVYLVPAFTGLGAPHWDPNARGAILGLNRDTGISEIITAGLQSVCYQTRDLLEAMKADGVEQLSTLRVDGGMVANDWLTQFLADIVNLDVDRPVISETTALGAAMLAALQAGIYGSVEELAENWRCEHSFKPRLDAGTRERLYQGWHRALEGVLSISRP
ncbi:MAG: glycerol kinase GlpK [Porticoccaceae bacterium]|nr:glycerol kinase GlpK [Porticoccaceae bacterium]